MNLNFLPKSSTWRLYILLLCLASINPSASEEATGAGDTPAPTPAPAESGEKMDTDDGKQDEAGAAVSEDELDDGLCNAELVRAYGFQGRVKPSLRPLEMCPTVKRNCCKVKDQLGIYASWVYGGQERLIHDRFDHVEKVYMNFLKVAAKVRTRAMEMKEKNRNQRISNCNIMADRIEKFEVDELIKQIKGNLEAMRKFFVTSFKGFYCGICNYDNHKFFDLEEKKVKVDDNFCYWTISHSLRVLLFFYNDVGPYINLLSQYMLTCSNTGEYRYGIVIPSKMLFVPHKEVTQSLVRCNDFIETNKWLPHCRFICDKFSIVGLSGFFEPNLDKLELYGKWLKAVYDEQVILETQPFDIRSKHKKKKSMADVLLEGLGPVVGDIKAEVAELSKDPNAKPEEKKEKEGEKKSEEKKDAGSKQTRRILEAQPEAKKEEPKKEEPKKEEPKKEEGAEAAKPGEEGKMNETMVPVAEDMVGEKGPTRGGAIRKDLVVFRNDLEARFPLEEFVYEYNEHGVDFYVEGKETLLTKEVYNQIKALIQLGRIVKNKANMLSIFDKDFGRHFWCSVGTWKVALMLSVLFSWLLKF